jgi:hypothetical protein
MSRELVRPWRFAVILGVFGLPAVAGAQAPAYTQPPYSPYLNLTRPGNIAQNYYGLVRPEVNFRNSLQGLQYQVGSLGQATNDLAQQGAGSLPATGHRTAFFNYSHYYGAGRAGPRVGSGASGQGQGGR